MRVPRVRRSARGADVRVCGVCVDSLSSILTKRTLSPGKLDEIKIKANILGAFRPAVVPVEEEDADQEIGRDTAEL